MDGPKKRTSSGWYAEAQRYIPPYGSQVTGCPHSLVEDSGGVEALKGGVPQHGPRITPWGKRRLVVGWSGLWAGGCGWSSWLVEERAVAVPPRRSTYTACTTGRGGERGGWVGYGHDVWAWRTPHRCTCHLGTTTGRRADGQAGTRGEPSRRLDSLETSYNDPAPVLGAERIMPCILSMQVRLADETASYPKPLEASTSASKSRISSWTAN